jgi:hypothetical protein
MQLSTVIKSTTHLEVKSSTKEKMEKFLQNFVHSCDNIDERRFLAIGILLLTEIHTRRRSVEIFLQKIDGFSLRFSAPAISDGTERSGQRRARTLPSFRTSL